MHTERFLMGRHREELSVHERDLLESAIGGIARFGARETVVRRGTRVDRCMLLIEGMICRYMDGLDGDRQLVALHVPGDFVDLHGFPMGQLDHDVATITECTVAIYPRETIAKLVAENFNLGRLLWFSTLLDAAMHREWIFRLGRLGADGRVAHLLSELGRRLEMVGLSDGHGFALPLQQIDLASACGITAVHMSRVLKDLRERAIVTFAQGEVRIADRAALHALAEFDDGYLYPSPR